MRVISETRYYKALAKLYKKCASLSQQLDIYEIDKEDEKSSSESNSEYLQNIHIKEESDEQPKRQKKIIKKKKIQTRSRSR